MSAQYQRDVFRGVDQFVPHFLRPVSRRQFITFLLDTFSRGAQERMRENDDFVIAEFFGFDQLTGPIQRFVAGSELKSYYQDIAPCFVMKFKCRVFHGVYPLIIAARGDERIGETRIAFGIDVLGHG